MNRQVSNEAHGHCPQRTCADITLFPNRSLLLRVFMENQRVCYRTHTNREAASVVARPGIAVALYREAASVVARPGIAVALYLFSWAKPL